MAELEKWLISVSSDVIRKNIYVRTLISASGYYFKHGYHEIWTADHHDDDIDGDTCVFQTEYGKWYVKVISTDLHAPTEDRYCKAISSELTDEELITYNTPADLGILYDQSRYQCICDRIPISDDIPDCDIWEYMGTFSAEYIKDNFFMQTTSEDVEDLMNCY